MGKFVIIAAIAAVFVAAVVYAALAGQRRTRYLEGLAAERGWNFSRLDDAGVKGRLEAVFPEEEFNPANLMKADGLVLFECGYSTRNRRPIALGAGVLFPVVRGPDTLVEIIARTAVDAALLGKGIDLGDRTFADRFLVYSKDEAAAKRLLDDRLRAVLLKHAAEDRWIRARINLTRDHAAVLVGALPGANDWEAALNFAREIEGALAARAR